MVASISFAAPLVLLAALAALAPVALHLLGRARAPRLEFAAMRFVRRASARTSRRRRIENLALLLLRAGLMALLPVALALPFYRSGRPSGAADDGLAVALVIDDTGSMSQKTDGQTAFERARLWGLRLVRGSQELPAPGHVAVVTVTGTRGPRVFSGAGSAAEAIRSLEPADAEGRLGPAVQAAAQALDELPAADKVVYVLTDFQEATFEWPDGQIAGETPVVLLELGDTGGSNMGIGGVRPIGPAIAGKPLTIRVELAGRLSEPAGSAVQAISDDGQVLASQQVYLDRGPLRHAVDLSLPPLPDRDLAIRAELSLSDALPSDNRRCTVLHAAASLKVMIVTDEARYGDWQDDPGFFVAAALRAAGWFEVQRVAVEEFLNSDLEAVHAVYLAELTDISDPLTKKLTAFTEQDNRTLVIFPSIGEAVPGYAELLGRLGVGRVGEAVQSEPAARVAEARTSDVLLANLSDDMTTYNPLAASDYVPIEPASGAATLISLEGGAPLLVRSRPGKSTVYTFATTARPATGSLPMAPVFPALLAEMPVGGLGDAQGGDRDAGEVWTIEEAGRVVDAEGKTLAEVGGEGGRAVLWRAGLYRVVGSDDAVREHLAVNVSPRATDLVRTDEVGPTVAGRGQVRYLAEPDRELPEVLTELSKGRPMWDYVLAVALVAMLGETFVANLHRGGKRERKPSASVSA